MTLRHFLSWLGMGMCLLVAIRSSFAVSLGATKAQVIEELGRPSSAAARGEREILSYPKGVRLILIDGRVDSANGIVLSGDTTESPKPPAAAVQRAAPTAPATPAAAATEESSEDAPPDTSKQDGSSMAKHPTSDSVAPAAKPHIAPNFDPEAFAHHAAAPSKARPLLEVVALLGFHFVVTLIALKLAFKFWTMDALLSGLFAIAAIDLGLHVVLELLGLVTSGITTIPAVENGLAGVVMIFTIRHYCFNKNIADAVQTASVVKVAVTLLKVFGAVAMLNAAFR